MSLALQGVLVCVCLIGTGIFLFLRDPADVYKRQLEDLFRDVRE